MPRVPLLVELEPVVELEVVAEVDPVVELEVVAEVEPVVLELVLVVVVSLVAPPAPPFEVAGSFEPPHAAVPSKQATASVCMVRGETRVVRIMSLNSS